MENKVINFGIVSTAGIASKYFPAFQDSPNTNLVAVASRSQEKAKQWAEKNNLNIKSYGTYEELFQDKEVDAVYIPLPTGLKYEFTKKALESGKHALIEKPLPGSIDTKEAQELIELSEKQGLQLMEGTMWLHSDRTHAVRKLLDSGEIGKVSKVISSLTFKSDNDFLLNNIRGEKELEPLGALGDVTWYAVGAALWTFNYEVPLKVQAISYTKNEKGVYTELSGIVYFKDNRVGIVEGSFVDCHRQNFEIVGEFGSYRLDDYVGGQNQDGDGSAFWRRYSGAGNYQYFNKDGKREERTLEKSDHVVNMVNEFVSRIRENDKTSYWAKRSLLCQQVCVQLHLSAEQNGAVLGFNDKL